MVGKLQSIWLSPFRNTKFTSKCTPQRAGENTIKIEHIQTTSSQQRVQVMVTQEHTFVLCPQRTKMSILNQLCPDM